MNPVAANDDTPESVDPNQPVAQPVANSEGTSFSVPVTVSDGSEPALVDTAPPVVTVIAPTETPPETSDSDTSTTPVDPVAAAMVPSTPTADEPTAESPEPAEHAAETPPSPSSEGDSMSSVWPAEPTAQPEETPPIQHALSAWPPADAAATAAETTGVPDQGTSTTHVIEPWSPPATESPTSEPAAPIEQPSTNAHEGSAAVVPAAVAAEIAAEAAAEPTPAAAWPAPAEPSMPTDPTASVESPTPTEQPQMPIMPQVGTDAPPALEIKKRRSLKPAIIAVLAVVLLGGSSAAAYYGVVVPNQPENVLKAALVNSVQQEQVTAAGTAETAVDNTGYKVSFTAAANTKKKVAVVNAKITLAGADVSVEARLINGNVYVKLGDLTTLAALLGNLGSSYSSLGKVVSGELSNQWVLVDSTLLTQVKASCALTSSWSLTIADLELLNEQYEQHPFVTITSTSTDKVNGKSVEKMVLSIDDDKSAVFASSKGLQNLSIVKSLNSCYPSASKGVGKVATTGDHDKTPLTVWIDKSNKTIVKIATDTTAQDAKNGITGSATILLSYGNVTVETPTGAKPLLLVLSELQTKLGPSGLSNLRSLGGF